ncbi:hypothetical protein BDV93DRAFT_234824 [Ceratobasidium sp. AG-I]|nr:hypothetical protein BDV93DRAFT_234824 [Ceratobasidium sp. AG-I]
MKLMNGSFAGGFSLVRCTMVSLTLGTAGVDGFEELPDRSTTRTRVVTAGVRSLSEVVSTAGVEGRDGFFSTGGGTEGVLGRASLSVVLLIFMLADGAGEGAAGVEARAALNGGGAGVLGAGRENAGALPLSFFISLSVSIASTSSSSKSSKGSESSTGAGGGGGGGGGGEGARTTGVWVGATGLGGRVTSLILGVLDF